jgi:hypothetical protein
VLATASRVGGRDKKLDDEANPVPPIMRGDGNLQQLCKINLLKLLLLLPLNPQL